EDFYQALNTTMQSFCETTGWDYGEAWVPNNGQLVCYATWLSRNGKLEEFGKHSQKFRFKLNQGLPGRVWDSKKPEWIENVTLKEEFFFNRLNEAKLAGLKAAFGIPVISDNKVQVIIVFFMKKPQKEDRN